MSILAALEAKLAELERRILALEGTTSPFKPTHTTHTVLLAVCEATNLREESVKGPRRFKELTAARGAIVHMLYMNGYTPGVISAVINRDRSVIYHHLRKPPPNDIIRQAEKLLARTG